jgi:steroid delta-isomerase-like uncharacterized protein
MSVQDNIRLVEEFIAAWNAGDADRAVALLSDDVVWEDVATPEPMRGKGMTRPHLQSRFTAFPDGRTTIKNRVVTEDQVAAEVEFSGTHTGPLQRAAGAPSIPATGKKVIGKGAFFVRIRNGKAVEVHNYWDRAGLLIQLGLIPSPGG